MVRYNKGIMISRIFLATDGSSFSEMAGSYAIYLAGCTGASMTAFHVIQIKPPQSVSPKAVDRVMVRRAELCFDGLLERAGKADLGIETKIVTSRSTVDAILEEAEGGGYDLIVMGSRGTSGITKILLGSVSEEVVKKAPCPVLIVR
jgi:nucleotide-binding universal stress UspA family protein